MESSRNSPPGTQIPLYQYTYIENHRGLATVVATLSPGAKLMIFIINNALTILFGIIGAVKG